MTSRWIAFAAALLVGCGDCDPEVEAWTVEQMEIPLYHSTTADPETGNFFHIEYCGVKLTRRGETVHLVYRPIDYPERNPGFSKGDRLLLSGEEEAEDHGAMDGRDYWITDVKLSPLEE